MTTVIEILKKSADFLAQRGAETPRLDAEVLLAHGLKVRRIDLYLQHDRPLADAELASLRTLIVERGRGVPVAHLTGEREFFSLPFHVTPSVLVPRPDTERLVEVAIEAMNRGEALNRGEAPRFIDVGTGTGCIAVAVLVAIPTATAIATDVVESVLEVAERNARRNKVGERLTFACGSYLEPLRGTADWGRLDAVLSNPPYIVRGDPTLAPDVAAHEPERALYVSGVDPLEPAREIASAAFEALKPGGLVAIEVGAGHAPAGEAMLQALGYSGVVSAIDGGGIARVVHGRKPA